jgi:hypothetical protein
MKKASRGCRVGYAYFNFFNIVPGFTSLEAIPC